MNTRTRLLRVFQQQEVDCIPVSPFIHINVVKEFFRSHDIDIVAQTIEVYDHFGFDIIHRNCTPKYNDIEMNDSGWDVKKAIQKQGRDEVTTTVRQYNRE